MYCMFKMLPLSLYVHEREWVKVNVFLVHKLNELLNILVQLFWLGLSLKCLCSCSFNSFRCCESSPAFMIICMSLFFCCFCCTVFGHWTDKCEDEQTFWGKTVLHPLCALLSDGAHVHSDTPHHPFLLTACIMFHVMSCTPGAEPAACTVQTEQSSLH